MGREYRGDIQGKFWFAIQASNDADHFGGSAKPIYRFRGCDCEAYEDETFCRYCYPSYERHYKEYMEISEEMEENPEVDKEGSRELVYHDQNQFQYQFTYDQLERVKDALRTIERRYASYITTYQILDDGYGIGYQVEYDTKLGSLNENEGEHSLFEEENYENYDENNRRHYSNVTFGDDDGERMVKLINIARICLGRQIVYCLEKHHSCTFTAEC